MADLSTTNWSEVDASNNLASPNGWPEGMMPSGVNDSARADKGALKRFWDRANPIYGVAPSGGVWTLLLTNNSYPTAYTNGEIFTFNALGGSSAGDQFSVNGLPAKPIYVMRGPATGGDTIKPYDIAAGGCRPMLVYDSTLAAGAGGFMLLNPLSPLSGNGTTGGTMYGTLTINPGSLSVSNAISATGDITAGGNLNATGGSLLLRGQYVITTAAFNTGYTILNDTSGVSALYLGSTANPVNLYRNTTHQFQSRGGTTTFMTVDNTGAAVTGGLYATTVVNAGSLAISGTGNISGAASFGGSVTIGGTGTGIAYTPYGGHSIGFGWTGSVINAYVNGSNVGPLVIPSSGNVSLGGTLTAAAINIGAGTITCGTVNASGTLFGNGANVGAGTVVCGTINASGTGLFTGALQCNGGIVLPANVTMTGGTGTFFNNGAGQWAQRDDVHGFQSRNGGVQFAYFDATGTHNISGAWLTGSDASLKQDITPFTARGLAAVRALNPVTFRYRPGTPFHVEGARPLLGLIAGEVEPHVPEIVGEMTAEIDGEERTVATLQPSNLVYVLVRAVQELADKVDALTGEPHAAD